MRITVAVNGTRGDAQPAVILAGALAARGHDVRVGVPPNLIGLAATLGVTAGKFGHDTRAHLERVRQVRTAAGRNPIRRARAVAAINHTGWSETAADLGALTTGADAIVTGFTTELIALPFAEALGIPLVSLHHAPVRPNSSVGPLPQLPGALGGPLVPAQWSAAELLVRMATRRQEAALRERLGVRPATEPLSRLIEGNPGVEIQAYDPMFAITGDPRWETSVRPRPAVGFIELARQAMTTATDPALDAWLDAGSAPVYFGFGSMPVRDSQATVTAMITAARRVGRRALICTGWSSARVSVPAGDDVFFTDTVDHHAVLGRCAAAVHHGGAGTTALALRHGIPSVICWFGADQPFWGAQLRRAGAGVTMPVTRLTADSLENALHTVDTDMVRRRALNAARAMVGADVALDAAVTAVETAVGEPGVPVRRVAR
ncbi:glycosyltransferase [Gordonia amarae]|uniref:Glycosyltransferase n=2 Tax=Gordonia amarae TaxID=36821 RepID=A0A857LSQ4_9ACTN|nr:glycosyltransferase [Gordonia amarae]MCS3880638.1 UDP:flavonoid glycosyltransferase YjiC (YdhE family) [Gordonia amarae]QHN18945.1 glycosyltransferase [Gordonia amarae]QHN23420.1 glycosyltransferase [Gordonia amarae]QHN32321.1 glycosyltransferase [Gordonia amarae]QHN41069.1 glycosyltransferase [Gordonia amarae]